MKAIMMFFLITMATITAMAQLPAWIPADGLVAWYPFNGTPIDESGNDNNPTYVGNGVTLTSDRFGQPDRAYEFNGNDYIRIPADNLPQTDRTVSLWFNVPMVSNRPDLLGYGGAGYLGYGTSFLMGINICGLGSFQTQAHYASNLLDYFYDTEPLDEWIHWLITIHSDTIRCYVNGELKQTAKTFTSITYTTGKDLSFGVIPDPNGIAPYTDPNGTFLQGKLDDIAIWNRALSQAEITDVYTGFVNAIDNKSLPEVIIFPNPAIDKISIVSPSIVSRQEYYILNVRGQECMHGEIRNGSIEIKISSILRGLYLVKIIGENGQHNLRFIKY